MPYGEHVTLPENPQREDWYFAGWYADMDLKTMWDFENDTVQGNMTLYARWTKDKERGVRPDGRQRAVAVGRHRRRGSAAGAAAPVGAAAQDRAV